MYKTVKNISGPSNFTTTILWYEFSGFNCGVFPSVDLLGSYTVHNKMLKPPPEQNSVTLKMDTAKPSEIRYQLLSYLVKKNADHHP